MQAKLHWIAGLTGLVLALNGTAGGLTAQLAREARAPRPDPFAQLRAEPERLQTEFIRLRAQALREESPMMARQELLSFLRARLLPYLSASVTLYSIADSVAGTAGYILTAAMFDGEAIVHQVKELDQRVADGNAGEFRARATALEELLELYFSKQHLMVAPIVARLSEAELNAVMERIAAEQAAGRSF